MLLLQALTLQSGGWDAVPVPEHGFCLLSLSSPSRPHSWAPACHVFLLPVSSRLSESTLWGPGPEPKGRRDGAVLNFRLGYRAVTIFSKLKISVDDFTV